MPLWDHTTTSRESWSLDGYKAGEWSTLWTAYSPMAAPNPEQIGNLVDSGFTSLAVTRHTPPTDGYKAWYNMLVWNWTAPNLSGVHDVRMAWLAAAKCN